MMDVRSCTKCGEDKPATSDYFYKHGDGLDRTCKECRREWQRQYYAAHPDEDLERKRRWRVDHPEEHQERNRRRYAKHGAKWGEHKRQTYAANGDERREQKRQDYASNAEARREYARRWRIEHHEAYRARDRSWRAKNRDKVRASQQRDYAKHGAKRREDARQWAVKHPAEKRVNDQRRRARVVNAPGTHTAADIRLQLKGQTDKLGKLRCWWCGKVIKDQYHIDHVIPLDKGGSNGAENIVIAHAKCNLSKQTKTPAEYMGRLL